MKIRELAISGGGVKGYSYIGALYQLEKRKYLNELNHISCVSIGAFIGGAHLAGYTFDELIDVFFHLNVKDLKDIDLNGFFKTKSMLKGDKYREFVKDVLSKKINPSISLLDLYKKTKIKFTIVTINVTNMQLKYISYETDPELDLYTAIIMSSAIHGVFPPVEYKNCLYIDGGILDNNPINILSRDAWGICESEKQEYAKTENILDYFGSILYIVYNSINRLDTSRNWIKVNCDNVQVISFNITKDEKLKLIQNGIDGVNRIFPRKVKDQN